MEKTNRELVGVIASLDISGGDGGKDKGPLPLSLCASTSVMATYLISLKTKKCPLEQ